MLCKFEQDASQEDCVEVVSASRQFTELLREGAGFFEILPEAVGQYSANRQVTADDYHNCHASGQAAQLNTEARAPRPLSSHASAPTKKEDEPGQWDWMPECFLCSVISQSSIVHGRPMQPEQDIAPVIMTPAGCRRSETLVVDSNTPAAKVMMRPLIRANRSLMCDDACTIKGEQTVANNVAQADEPLVVVMSSVTSKGENNIRIVPPAPFPGSSVLSALQPAGHSKEKRFLVRV
jgi:hypothetical protein